MLDPYLNVNAPWSPEYFKVVVVNLILLHCFHIVLYVILPDRMKAKTFKASVLDEMPIWVYILTIVFSLIPGLAQVLYFILGVTTIIGALFLLARKVIKNKVFQLSISDAINFFKKENK